MLEKSRQSRSISSGKETTNNFHSTFAAILFITDHVFNRPVMNTVCYEQVCFEGEPTEKVLSKAQAVEIGFFRWVHGVHFATTWATVKFVNPWMLAHFSESKHLNYIDLAMCPECSKKIQAASSSGYTRGKAAQKSSQDQVVWLHLRPGLFQFQCGASKTIWDCGWPWRITSLPRAPIHFWPHSFETTVIWEHIHLRPHSFETTFIWDHNHLRSHSFYAMLKLSCFDLLLITFLWSAFHIFAGLDVICWNSRVCRDHVSDVLLIRSYISVLKSYEIFLMWVFRPTQNDIFFSSFIFSWKLELLWRLDKGKGRNAKHVILWRGLNYILN